MLLTNQLEKLQNDKYQLTPQRRAVLKALNDTMAEQMCIRDSNDPQQ